MKRIDSLDFLRGWASVLVVISHLVGVFWVSQSGLEHLMGYSNIGDISLPHAQWIIENRLFFGQLGVAIFFLISGYVITFSLEKYHGFGFLVNRIIRIYPVYIVGFSMTILGLYLVDFQHDGIPYTLDQLLVHTLIIVRHWLDFPGIDGISWTLEIELYFYIIMFLLYQIPNKIKKYSIVMFFFMCIIIVYIHHLNGYTLKVVLMIGYMLIGYFFYMYKHNLLQAKYLILFTTIECISLYMYYQNNMLGRYFPYFVAPILFWLFLFYFKHYKIDFISKFLANISYSLYVVHPIFGYALLVYFLKNGYNSWFALVIVIFIVFIVSYIIHLLIEKPTLKYAKKFNHPLFSN